MMIHPKDEGHAGNPAGWTEFDAAHDALAMRLMTLADAFEAHGREILDRARQAGPATLWFFVSGILAWDEAIDLGWSPSDADLGRLVERIVAALRAGTPDEDKCRR